MSNDPLAAFRTLSQPDQPTVENVGKLILDDDLSIVWGLFLSSTPKDLDSISSIILKFFDQHGRQPYLMEQAITKEIQLTSDSATLFRQNNFASKLLSTYSKRFGLSYVKYCLNDIIVNICLNHQDNPDWSCEIDPSKLGKNKERLAEQNLQHLRQTCASILDRVLNSIDQLPAPFRHLCVHLKTEASTKFPDAYPRTTFASVGGFIFLRFLCPAVVVPHKYGLLEIQPGQVIIRDLMLISKVLQTVANGVFFGKKESYLIPMNEFVEQYHDKVLAFLDKLGDSEGLERKRSASVELRTPPLVKPQRQRSGTHNAVPSKTYAPSPLSNGAPLSPKSQPVSKSKEEKEIKEKSEESKQVPKEETEDVAQEDKTKDEATKTETTVSRYTPPTAPLEKTNFDDHTFSYGELMGIIQYLTIYWQKMKPHLIKMDNNLGTKHTEDYIQLSTYLEKLGVTPQEVVTQFSPDPNATKKKGKGKAFFNVFSRKSRKSTDH